MKPIKEYYPSIIKIIGGCILVIITISGFLLLFMGGFFSAFIEKALNEEPEKKITAYIGAVKQGNTNDALAIWELPDPEGWKTSEEFFLLENRRKNLTENFILNGITNFEILKVEWWSGFCCMTEPYIVNDTRDGGYVRAYVKLFSDTTDKGDNEYVYIFVLSTRDDSFGALASYPVRYWVIRDIYPSTQKPLFWKFFSPK